MKHCNKVVNSPRFSLELYRISGKEALYGFVFLYGRYKFVGVFPYSIYSDSKDANIENTNRKYDYWKNTYWENSDREYSSRLEKM